MGRNADVPCVDVGTPKHAPCKTGFRLILGWAAISSGWDCEAVHRYLYI